jgi:hypothetical protein
MIEVCRLLVAAILHLTVMSYLVFLTVTPAGAGLICPITPSGIRLRVQAAPAGFVFTVTIWLVPSMTEAQPEQMTPSAANTATFANFIGAPMSTPQSQSRGVLTLRLSNPRSVQTGDSSVGGAYAPGQGGQGELFMKGPTDACELVIHNMGAGAEFLS